MSVTNGNGLQGANGHSQQQLSKEQNFSSGNGVDMLSTVIASVQSSESKEELSLDVDVKLLPSYQDLTLFDAIAKLLQDNTGTILKLDFIVRSLYGKLQRCPTHLDQI